MPRRLLAKLLSFFVFVRTRLSSLRQKYTGLSPRRKMGLLRISGLILVAALLVWRFGYLFSFPQIAVSFPGQAGTEIPLDSKIEVIFDRAVIKPLAEKSFTVTPSVPGKFTWEGDRQLVFTPNEPLSRSYSYQVRFPKLVLSKFLIPLRGSAAFTFSTIGLPKVVLASPQFELPEDGSPITVVFDRPMIALTTATNSAFHPPAFSLSPDVKGEGRWLGTTAYQFRPADRYRRATTYTVTVDAGLVSKDGGQLQPYSWEFSSTRPRIDTVSPLSGYDYASPTASVAATFNQALDSRSVADKFILLDQNQKPVSGKTTVIGRMLAFHPAVPLSRGQTYQAKVIAGVRSLEGPNGLEMDYSWFFTTAPLPKITGTGPADGTKDVTDQYNIGVNFASPMKESSFKGNITVDPAPKDDPDYYFSSYQQNHHLTISTPLKRSTAYTVTIGAGVKDQYGVALGAPYTFQFTTGPYPPGISMFPGNTYFGAFNQQVIPRVVTKVTNADKVNYSLYKITRDDLMSLYRRHHLSECGNKGPGCYTWQDFDTGKLSKIRDWSESFDLNFNVPTNVITKVTNPDSSPLSPGFYFLRAGIANSAATANLALIVTKSALTLKTSPSQVLVWAVDQSTGQVIPDMRIELANQNGQVLAQGTTNADGVFMQAVDLFQKSPLFAFGTKDDDLTFVTSAWNDGINRYDFGLPSYYDPNAGANYNSQDQYRLFLATDRPIYRPGHHLYFTGVVRKDNDGAYENISPGEPVTVTLTDARGRQIFNTSLPLNSFGAFNGDFVLSPEANLGDYRAQVTFRGNSFSQSFQVEEYRRPDLSVAVNMGKTAYVQSDTAIGVISSSYYFGAPVASAPVTWILQTQDDYFRWDRDWRFEFGDADDYWSRPWWDYGYSNYYSGEQIAEGKGQTDDRGELRFSKLLDIGKYSTSQKMILEAVVNDRLNNQSIAASDEFTVHKAGIYVGIKPTSYSNRAGQSVPVELVTLDVSGKELPQTTVQVSIYKRVWNSIREQNPDDGIFYYVSKPEDSQVFSTPAQTDAFGRTTVSFIPAEGGTYKVVASVTDTGGRTNGSGSFLWVSGPNSSAPRENHDRILVVTDKLEYQVGDPLSLYVATPYASESAKTLLTVERGNVLEYRLVDTGPDSNDFQFTVSEKFAPNAFLSALLVRPGSDVRQPPEFKMGFTEVKAADQKQQLDVRVQTDKTKYKPGDVAKISVTTKNMTGQALSTQLAVALVDQATWDLSQVTPADLYKTFYQPKNLSVSTAQLLTMSLDRINANTNLGSKGGSGGGPGDEGGRDTTRRNFPDTAYWNPDIKTDAGGKAEFTIPLPDNLTTWRLFVWGYTANSAFGSRLSSFTVSRDVLIRPFLPRFLAVGDKAKLGAIVVNTSGIPQTLTARVRVQGLDLSGSDTSNFTLADGAQTKILWPVTASATTSAAIRLEILGSDLKVKDALETTLPVLSYSVPEVIAASGQAKDVAEEKINLPLDVDHSQGRLDITLSPSLGSASFTALPYLFNYPYSCAEQTTSRLLPAVMAYRTLTAAKVDSLGSVDKAQLSAVITDSLQRLNSQQHPDGGWGWWMEYQSDPYLTAYAYLGLSEAKSAGLTVADQTLSKAREFLKGQLAAKSSAVSLDTQAFILYVLNDSSPTLSSYAANLFARRFELSVASRAYLAIAAKNLPGMGVSADRLYHEVVNLGKKTATVTHWEEGAVKYSYFGSNTTTTAAVLEALTVFEPKSPLISETVRYLISIRRDNHWASTRDTSAVIHAVSRQLLSGKETKLSEDFKVTLNDQLLFSGKFAAADLLRLQSYSYPVADLSLAVDNNLQITKSGSGNLYYNLNLKYFLPFSEIEPLDQGLVIIREFVDAGGKILPAASVKENTEFWVRLIVVAPADRYYVVIEDVLPAGLESVNESLKNVSSLNASRPRVKDNAADEDSWYFHHREYHDDRTTLFADYLPSGVYEFMYRVRSTTPGRYHYPPAQVYQMYTPDVSGHSSGGFLDILPR